MNALLHETVHQAVLTGSLQLKHLSPVAQQRRDAFVADLSALISEAGDASDASLLAQHMTNVAFFEEGFQLILTTLDKADVSKLPPDLQLWGLLYGCGKACNYVRQQFWDALKNTPQRPIDFSSFAITDEHGNAAQPDVLLGNVILSTSSALKMLSYKHGWFDAATGTAIFPALTCVSSQVQDMAGTVWLLSNSWDLWEDAEQHQRMRSGTRTEEVSVAPTGEQVTVIRFVHNRSCELPAFIAEARLRQMKMRFLCDLTSTTAEERIVATRDAKRIALPPEQYVSTDELHATLVLSHLLCESVPQSGSTPGGLRISEWLRCYSWLKLLAFGEQQERPAIQCCDRTWCMRALRRVGISQSQAEVFINHATFSRSSKDLYDCPLLTCADGRMYLFANAVRDMDVSAVVLSQIGRFPESMERKGKAFEQDIRNCFIQQGIPAKGFAFTVGRDEYEFDACVLWGTKLFIFECKSRVLPSLSPAAIYWHEQQVHDDVKQVLRLRDGVLKYPGEVRRQFDSAANWTEVIPCVLYALPYSSRPVDGAYVYDSSALHRFFESRYININIPARVSENVHVLRRIGMVELWKGTSSTPEDLIAQMTESAQVRYFVNEYAVRDATFPLSPTRWAAVPSYRRLGESMERMCTTLGVEHEAVQRDIADFGKKLNELREWVEKATRKGRTERL
jgi:hypothetical protein